MSKSVYYSKPFITQELTAIDVKHGEFILIGDGDPVYGQIAPDASTEVLLDAKYKWERYVDLVNMKLYGKNTSQIVCEYVCGIFDSLLQLGDIKDDAHRWITDAIRSEFLSDDTGAI